MADDFNMKDSEFSLFAVLKDVFDEFDQPVTTSQQVWQKLLPYIEKRASEFEDYCCLLYHLDDKGDLRVYHQYRISDYFSIERLVNLRQIIHLYHPQYRLFANCVGAVLVRLMMIGPFKSNLGRHKLVRSYTVNLPISLDGHVSYKSIKMTSSGVSFDSSGKMIGVLCEYELAGDMSIPHYLHPKIHLNQGIDQIEKYDEQFLKFYFEAIQKFYYLGEKKFPVHESLAEFLFLHARHKGLKTKCVSEMLHKGIRTIEQYNGELKQWVESSFPIRFGKRSNIHDVMEFLNGQGLTLWESHFEFF